ncbi:hypothetical protein K466DRAFT_253407 [Polyporus arcularius HHB13444]|uniref:Uncharacterized protein n=1 Tax=Polyporus arcularius HHB13444 TaxID=1314778 RepID=A0A5C3P5W2_9APHY|nr:hypothetical protein K466DRAFT_253407 [Polyporus arcularius HHB13444]
MKRHVQIPTEQTSRTHGHQPGTSWTAVANHSRLPSQGAVLLKLQASIFTGHPSPSGDSERRTDERANNRFPMFSISDSRSTTHNAHAGANAPHPRPCLSRLIHVQAQVRTVYSIEPHPHPRPRSLQCARAGPTSCAVLAPGPSSLECECTPGTTSRCASSGPADLQRGPDRPRCRAVPRAGAGALHMPAHSTRPTRSSFSSCSSSRVSGKQHSSLVTSGLWHLRRSSPRLSYGASLRYTPARTVLKRPRDVHANALRPT